MSLLLCPLQSFADSGLEELNRLRALSSRVELQLPADARARLNETQPDQQQWYEDSLSVTQAAPSRSPALPSRALVQEDLELEASVLESFEYSPNVELQENRRQRSR
jgi:hypothetical protein